MGIFCGYHGQGGVQTPADYLCGTAKVPPSVVGFFAAVYPGYWDVVPARGVRAARGVSTGPP